MAKHRKDCGCRVCKPPPAGMATLRSDEDQGPPPWRYQEPRSMTAAEILSADVGTVVHVVRGATIQVRVKELYNNLARYVDEDGVIQSWPPTRRGATWRNLEDAKAQALRNLAKQRAELDAQEARIRGL
jgi:hypothetical protein